MKKVLVREEMVTIPTYEIAEYDKNPMFLEKRVYQGSSGRVYPHPVCEGVANEKTDRQYHAIYLENDYLLVMILPEIGGRIQRLYDKTNGYDAVYYNEVIKPALVGLAGPWISGGIEFNWPQHHRPSTFDPVDSVIEEHEDGSVTVWTGETEKMFHIKGMAGFTVYPDRAYLEIRGQVYNPTDRPQTFLWWANPAVAVNEDTQSIFPPDVHAVMDHGKRDVSKFPIADGVYYKVDYSPGTDISRYKNIPVPTSYMAYHSDFDFIGNYDYKKQAGLLHVADHHVAPGKKQWTWGNGDFGKAWDRNLTDENGPYIELMTGMFTDNQPDFTYLKPYEEKSFVQYFMPYQHVGAVKNASAEVVLNLELSEGAAMVSVYAPCAIQEAELEIVRGDKTIFAEKLNLQTAESFEETIIAAELTPDADDVTVRVKKGERELLHYTPVKTAESVPSPAEEIPKPQELDTNEKLFLAAVHLEQYRHATRSPEAYYLEGLRRDSSDIRLNNGYGKYLYQKGCFAESEKYFRAAAASSVWKNPNPYDCEPYYNLGLSCKAQGKTEEAEEAFYKAAWDGSMQDKAFYQLACMEAVREPEKALKLVEQSLIRGWHNLKARTLKTVLLRHMGRVQEAVSFAEETMRIDPLDHGCRYELYCMNRMTLEELQKLMRGENHNYIELALCYRAAGLKEDEERILRLAPQKNEPMVHYYLYSSTAEKAELQKAETADSRYCFPNRLEDMQVLREAVQAGGNYAAYYLGNLLYDRGRAQEARTLWESCAANITLPTVYRNLALVYYNKLQDAQKAKQALEKAFSMDESDARVFFELDQLYRAMNLPVRQRLENMEAHAELLEKRDDLYTEYITLLNLEGDCEKAYRLMMSHHFHPWEGGEGKIPAQYRKALIQLARMEKDPEKASGLLKKALVYPHNLGEGKLKGNLDNDIYYLLGELSENEKEARQFRELAARGEAVLSSAVYYNDQPPEMRYYAALALRALGEEEEAQKRFKGFLEYADAHRADEPEIEYFAVSLPDFLIFEADLSKKNKVHCLYMEALGHLGLGERKQAEACARQGLALEQCHVGLIEILKG